MSTAISHSGSQAASGSNWFEHLSRSKTTQLRVFCLPYAGGSADVFRSWQSWFPAEIDLCLVHLPGRGRSMRDQPFTRCFPLVQALADRITAEIDVPYILYGHSLGALLSFELTHELTRRNLPGPRRLLVSGRRAPQWPATERRTFDLAHDEFISELKRLDGTSEEFFDSPELMELFIHLIRSDFEIAETHEYQARKPLLCPIMVYGGLDDVHVPVESCHDWQKQTWGSCKVRMFKGNHFFIRNPGQDFITTFRNDVLRAIPMPGLREL